MPGFDGTGPAGAGPRTGGGFGYCPPGRGPAVYGGYGGGFGVGRGGRPRGGGRGRAWGGGRGWGRGYYGPPPFGAAYPPAYQWPSTGNADPGPTDELGALEAQAEGLEQELKAIRERIEQFKK